MRAQVCRYGSSRLIAAACLVTQVLLTSTVDARPVHGLQQRSAFDETQLARQQLLQQATRLQSLVPLYELVQLREHLADPTLVDKAIATIATRKNTHAIVRDHARYLNSLTLRRQGDSEQAQQELRDSGIVDTVWLLGPFDNTGGAAFATAPLNEQEIDLNARSVGKEHELRWRRLPSALPDAYVDIGARVEPDAETIVYVLFEIDSDRARTVALRIGNTDQLCVRVGAHAFPCVDARRDWAFEQKAYGVSLPKGKTPVLLRLGHVGGGAFRVSVRLTQLDGRAVGQGVSVSLPARDKLVRMQESPVTEATALDIFAGVEAKTCQKRPKACAVALKQNAKLLSALNAFDRRQDPTLLTDIVDAALGFDDTDAELWLMRGAAVVEHDANQAREAYLRAVKLEPGFVRAQLELGLHRFDRSFTVEAFNILRYAQSLDSADPLLAVAYCDALASTDPDPAAEYRFALSYAQAQHWLVDKHRQPVHGGAMAARFLSLLRSRNLVHQANTFAEAMFNADQLDSYSLRVLISNAKRDGALDRATALYPVLARIFPQSYGPSLELAKLWAWNNQADKAQPLFVRLLAEFPDHADIPQAHGEALLLSGDKIGSIQAWRQSLALRPQQPELKRQLEALQSESDPFAAHVLDVAKLRGLAPVAANRAFGVEVLGQLQVTKLYANGLYSTVEEYAIRLLDRNFANAIRTRSHFFTPGREDMTVLIAERIDAQGRSHPPKAIDEQRPRGRQNGVYSDLGYKVVRFDTLDEGDIIHVRTRVDAVAQSNMFGDFFGAIVNAQGVWPTRHFEYIVEAPTSRPLTFHDRGLKHSQSSFDHDQQQRYRFYAHDLPGIRPEPNMPPLFEIVPQVSLSTYSRWQDMLQWYAKLVADQYQLDDETKKVAQNLVQDVREPRERVRRIYHYVLKKTRYVGIELGIHGWKPYRAALVHRRGYGDCKDKATLLVALLEAIGIDAKLVLLRTTRLGELKPEPPTMWAFNHAIAYVPSLDLFLDGTAEFSGLDELPAMDQGALAVVVDRTGHGEFKSPPLAPASQNFNMSEYLIRVAADGSATLDGKESFGGTRAASVRRRYNDEATRQELLEKDFSKSFSGAKVESVKFSPLDDLAMDVWYQFSSTLPQWGQSKGQHTIVPISLYPQELARAYAPTLERVYDIVLDAPWRTTNRMRFVLAPGLQRGSLPKSVRIDSPFLFFDQHIEPSPDGFVVEETTELRQRRIPQQDYQQFRRDCLQADAAMQQRLQLTQKQAREDI